MTDSWITTGFITARSRDTAGLYAGLSYTVLVNLPTGGTLEVADVIPADGQRQWDDGIVDIVPCEIGKEVTVVNVGDDWSFFFAELPAYGECPPTDGGTP